MADFITVDDRVHKIIAEHFSEWSSGRVVPKAFAWDDNLQAVLGADSLDVVELSIALEDEFGLPSLEDKTDGWRTAGDVLATVKAAYDA